MFHVKQFCCFDSCFAGVIFMTSLNGLFFKVFHVKQSVGFPMVLGKPVECQIRISDVISMSSLAKGFLPLSPSFTSSMRKFM